MVTNRRLIDGDGPDFYPTPRWATEALLSKETFHGPIWEPACGDGSMSKVLEEAGYKVISSDKFNRGYGLPDSDFLRFPWCETPRDIVTNPPFNLAEDFVKRGIHLCDKKLCLLLRLSFLESTKRYKEIFRHFPPSRVWVFSKRITFYPNGQKTGGSGTTAYAWFVWEKPLSGQTVLGWLP